MEFMNIIKLEFKLMLYRKEFQFAFTAMLSFVSLAFIINCINLYGKDISYVFPANQIWVGFSISSMIISNVLYLFILPFISSIAYSDTYFIDYNTGIYKNIFTRCNKYIYFLAKGITVFSAGFIIIFIPLLVNQLLSLIPAPLKSCADITNWPSYLFLPIKDMIFPNLFLYNPYLYNFLYMLIPALFGGIMALLSYSLSFYIKKSRLLVVSIVGILYVAENFLGSLLFDEGHSLFNYLFAFSFVKCLNENFFFSFMILCFILSIGIIIIKNLLIKDEI